MTGFETKGIGIAKIGLVVCAVLVVVLAVSNVWSYTHLQSQIDTLNEDKTSLQSQLDTLTSDKNSLQNQVSGLQSQVDSLTTDNDNLQNEVDSLQNQVNSLKAPQLHEVNVEWLDHHPWVGSPYISISGAIFNSGTNLASNVTITVKIYDSAYTLLRSEELIFGSIDGKSYKSFDTHIGYSGDADDVTTTLTHD